LVHSQAAITTNNNYFSVTSFNPTYHELGHEVWAKGDILEPVLPCQTVLQMASHLQQLMLEVVPDSLELLNEKPLSTTLHLANTTIAYIKLQKLIPFSVPVVRIINAPFLVIVL
jgi:hypothetical protein